MTGRELLEAIGRSRLSSSRYASKGVEMVSDGCQWQEEMAKCVSKSFGLVVVGRYLSRFIATDSYQLGSGVKRSFEDVLILRKGSRVREADHSAGDGDGGGVVVGKIEQSLPR